MAFYVVGALADRYIQIRARRASCFSIACRVLGVLAVITSAGLYITGRVVFRNCMLALPFCAEHLLHSCRDLQLVCQARLRVAMQAPSWGAHGTWLLRWRERVHVKKYISNSK